MKKRIVGLILVVTMVMTSVLPAFAADAKVQALYDAYVALDTALQGTDLAAVHTTGETFENVLEETLVDFDEAQLNEFYALMGMTEEEVLFAFIASLSSYVAVVGTEEIYNAYQTDKNVKTAYDFCELYDAIFNDPDYDDDDVKNAIRQFFADIDTVYAEAKTNLADEKVLNMYQSYITLEEMLQYGSLEQVEEALEDYITESEIAGESFGIQEWEDLACMLEKDMSEIHDAVAKMVVYAYVILDLGEVYEAFWDEMDADSASDFIEVYESIYENEENAYLYDVLENYFYDLDETYEEAKQVLKASQDDSKKVEKEEKEEKVEEVKSPKTGDSQNLPVWMFMILGMCGACVLVSDSKKRCKNK